MAAKKSVKEPKGRARKPAKIKNLPAKPLSGDDLRAVKGGAVDTFQKLGDIKSR